MKTLTDWFDRVYVINCAHRPDRLERVKAHLEDSGMADVSKVIFYPAIVGDWVTEPADWNSGKGAWGCLQSHRRIMEDVIQARFPEDPDTMLLRNVLVLEDDVFFTDTALADLNAFMESVPEDWGQLYLGGQHTRKPVKINETLMVGISINRTHAYAVNQPTFQPLYRHVSYMSDYRGTKKHIDHQLELAHQRRDWSVYCPTKWIAGQDEGSSNVSGKTNPRMIWNQEESKVSANHETPPVKQNNPCHLGAGGETAAREISPESPAVAGGAA